MPRDGGYRVAASANHGRGWLEYMLVFAPKKAESVDTDAPPKSAMLAAVALSVRPMGTLRMARADADGCFVIGAARDT
jgi:hypothetical protein